MGIMDTIKQRRSVRDFLDKPIPDDALDIMIEAVRWAPSAGNLQSRKFYFVLNQEIKTRLSEAALDQKFIARAPLVVVACADHRIVSRYGERGVNLYCIQDVSAGIQNLLLVCHDIGLGACWVGAFREGDVRSIINLGHELRPVAIIPIGYPGRVPNPPARLPKEYVVEFIK